MPSRSEQDGRSKGGPQPPSLSGRGKNDGDVSSNPSGASPVIPLLDVNALLRNYLRTTPTPPLAIKGDERELDTDSTRIIPRARGYRLYGRGTTEVLDRPNLIEKVSVDENGVAVSVNQKTGTTTRVAAVRIDDENHAFLVPLRLDNGHLVMELPEGVPSQVGFFIGHDSPKDLSGALHVGEFPGIPMITQPGDDFDADEAIKATEEPDDDNDDQKAENVHDEVGLRLQGMKTDELDERMWAEHIGLFGKLGFENLKVRGAFTRSHLIDPLNHKWASQRLVIVPDEMRDLVEHFDAYYVKKDAVQILVYGPREKSAFDLLFERTQEERTPLTMRYPQRGETEGGGMGVGFGNVFQQTARTSSANVGYLEAAFDIRFVSAKAA